MEKAAIYLGILLSLIGILPFHQPSCFGGAKGFNQGLDYLVRRITTDMGRHRKQYIAVSDFTDLNGTVSELDMFVSEEILTRLFEAERLKIVERRLLYKVIDEQELGLSGLLDPATVQRIGKILGVEAVCTGTITDLGRTFKINARMISVETGEVFAVASTEVDKSDALRILMRRYVHVRREMNIGEKDERGRGSGLNLVVNGGFVERYAGWNRRIGDMTQGSSKTEIVSSRESKSGKMLHIRHEGKGYIQFSQIVSVPTSDLVFRATFEASSHEGMIKAFSGTGIVQIGLQYLDHRGSKLGQTVLLNYVKNPFADTPLIGVPRRRSDTYRSHYIELKNRKLYDHYQIDIRKEVEDNLLGIDPDLIEQIAVILWCGATHPQAGSEMWITDIGLQMK